MKSKLIIVLLLLPIITIGQKQHKLVAKNGSQLIITSEITDVKEFIMEDNSTIVLSNITEWHLSADRFLIGNNCTIIGNGKKGADGRNEGIKGKTGSSEKYDKNGGKGTKGDDGENGTNGVNIFMDINIVDLGSLTINVAGGNGGNGKKGGVGGDGGPACISCDLPEGKRGGHGEKGAIGGAAGRGGKGGNVQINYCSTGIQPAINVETNSQVIKINNRKGENGKPGSGGEGGTGGSGIEEKIGFIKVKKGGGTNGNKGDRGNEPQPNSDGLFIADKVKCPDFLKNCYDDLETETYGLIVSISDYETPEPKWTRQALKLKETLEANYYFEEDIIHLNNPTQAKFQRTLFEYLNKGEDANVLVYISGHGASANDFYTFQLNDEDFVPIYQITNDIKRAKLNSLLFIFDACYSGKVLDDDGISTTQPTTSTLESADVICGAKGKTIITAGYEEELVDENFVDYLVTVLEKNTKKVITGEEIFFELVGKDEYNFETQRPSFGQVKSTENGDFILFRKDKD
ncbi:MAG: caspase family protein [Saprospiraceae bacterium]